MCSSDLLFAQALGFGRARAEHHQRALLGGQLRQRQRVAGTAVGALGWGRVGVFFGHWGMEREKKQGMKRKIKRGMKIRAENGKTRRANPRPRAAGGPVRDLV